MIMAIAIPAIIRYAVLGVDSVSKGINMPCSAL